MTDAQTIRELSLRADVAEILLAKIETIARRHCSPASNPGAHILAALIIRTIEGRATTTHAEAGVGIFSLTDPEAQ